MSDTVRDQLDQEDITALEEMAEWWREQGESTQGSEASATRRKFMGLLAGAGLGAASLGGYATGQAAAGTESVGVIGTQAEPADAYVEDLYDHNGNQPLSLPGDGSVSVGEETLTGGTVRLRYNSDEGNSASDTRTTTYQSIQGAIDALPIGAGRAPPEDPDSDNRAFGHIETLPVGDVYQEAVTVDKKHVDLRGYGQATHLVQDGSAHTLEVAQNDVFIQDIQVDHTGTGDYDAVHAAESTDTVPKDELQLFRVTVDSAPRYGFNIEHPWCNFVACEGTGGDEAALRLNAMFCQISNFKGQNVKSNGIFVDDDAAQSFISAILQQTDGYGLSLGDKSTSVSPFHIGAKVIIMGAGAEGIIIDSQNSFVRGIVINSTSDDVLIGSDAMSNNINVFSNGNLVVEAGALKNIIWGEFEGGVTDNGTRTIINGTGTNNGDPSSTGEWNGHAAYAYRNGAAVWDTSSSPATPYRATPSGSWVQD